MQQSFVALAIDADHPDPAVRALGAAHMQHARSLPFVIYTDENGAFLHGTSGGRPPADFLSDLQKVAAM